MKHVAKWIVPLALLIGMLVIAGSAWDLEPIGEKKVAKTLSKKEPYSHYVGRTYATDVFWGDTHVHISCSIEAGLAGSYTLGPEEAYQFARALQKDDHCIVDQLRCFIKSQF